MRFAMLVVAFASTYSIGAHANSPNAESWRQTTLDLDLTKKFISNDRCRSGSKYFESCFLAIESASKLVGVPGEDDYPLEYDFESKLAALTANLPAEIPSQMVLGTAINTHLKFFDAHAYIRPANQRLSAREADYVGIGFSAYKTERGFLVNEVNTYSPAQLAGLVFGDRVIAVGEETTPLKELSNVSADELGPLIRGPRGTIIQLEVERANGRREILKARRDAIRRLPVEFSPFPKDPDIGFIRVRLFVPQYTCSQVSLAFQQLSAMGAKNFVLDMRGNPGGDFYEALCVSGLLTGLQEQAGTLNLPLQIPGQDLIRVFDRSSEIKWFLGTTLKPTRRHLAILIDGQTGSSAEMVTGVLQNFKEAWVVGRQSFGKGTLQSVGDMPGHPSLLLAATVKRLYFRNNKSNQRVGITPSFNVQALIGMKENEILEEREGDVHPNASEAVNEPWEDERQTEIANIKSCIHEKKLDEHYLGRLGSGGADYQKAYAAAVLKCAK